MDIDIPLCIHYNQYLLSVSRVRGLLVSEIPGLYIIEIIYTCCDFYNVVIIIERASFNT